MLVAFFKYLDSMDFPGAGMFNYISFRSACAFILALVIATLVGGNIIRKLQKKQIGETIRNLDIEGQMSKKGTPTMGGIIIFISIIIPVLLFNKLDNIYVILMIISTVWLVILGFADDYIKVFKKDKEGMKGKSKIIGQIGISLIVGFTLYASPDVVIRENVEVVKGEQVTNVTYKKDEVKSTKTTIPFKKGNNLDYASLFKWLGKYKGIGTWIFFIILTVFIVTAVSNGANLSDGLDGLAAGSSGVIGVALLILAYVSSNVNYASYLNIMYIPGSGELVVYMAAFIGATIGFLWYNSYPAQVFMGDTGSLMLGGVIAVFAIIIRKELLIPVLCGIFLVEDVSVILQTTYFKYTKKKYGTGIRFFKMAPLHHHFQKKGNNGISALIQRPLNAIPESKIVVRFWLIGIILAAIAIATLKMR